MGSALCKPRTVNTVEQENAQPRLELYTGKDALFQLLRAPADGELAPVRLLDGAWLLKRAERCRAAADRSGMALPRRQDLELNEPEAFIDVERLAKLPCGFSDVGYPLPIVCVSYAWLTREHPDPQGDYLVLLATALRNKMMEDDAFIGKKCPREFAVFFDWCSLCQKDSSGKRTEPERRAFDTALETMQLWYASQKTMVYMLSKLPEGWEGKTKPYEERGWPTFERSVSVLVKMRSEYGWKTVHDVGSQEAAISPPLTPEAFDALLQTKTFTNGSDREVVSNLYRETLENAFGGVTLLTYHFGDGIDWGDEEAEQLAQVLPYAKRVVGVSLSNNMKMTARAGRSLARVIDAGAMPDLGLLGVMHAPRECPELKAACERRAIELNVMATHLGLQRILEQRGNSSA